MTTASPSSSCGTCATRAARTGSLLACASPYSHSHSLPLRSSPLLVSHGPFHICTSRNGVLSPYAHLAQPRRVYFALLPLRVRARAAGRARPQLLRHGCGVLTVAWCPDDSAYLLTGGKDNRVACWNTATGELISEVSPTAWHLKHYLKQKKPVEHRHQLPKSQEGSRLLEGHPRDSGTTKRW